MEATVLFAQRSYERVASALLYRIGGVGDPAVVKDAPVLEYIIYPFSVVTVWVRYILVPPPRAGTRPAPLSQ